MLVQRKGFIYVVLCVAYKMREMAYTPFIVVCVCLTQMDRDGFQLSVGSKYCYNTTEKEFSSTNTCCTKPGRFLCWRWSPHRCSSSELHHRDGGKAGRRSQAEGSAERRHRAPRHLSQPPPTRALPFQQPDPSPPVPPQPGSKPDPLTTSCWRGHSFLSASGTLHVYTPPVIIA